MLIGAVIGAAITIGVFQLRGGAGDISAKPGDGSASAARGSAARSADAIESPGARSNAERGGGPIDRSREIQALRTRIAELEAEGASTIGIPDQQIGMSTDDGWWSRLAPNPAWDDAREAKVRERLADNFGIKLEPAQVECKTRCCRIALPDEIYDESLEEITSSVGLAFEPPDGIGTSKHGDAYLVTACWSTRPIDQPIPDRAVERAALITKTRAAIEKCGQGMTPIITLKLQLFLDEGGQIEKVESNAKQLGQKAATCAETALLQAASFAASPMTTRVPITVLLGS